MSCTHSGDIELNTKAHDVPAADWLSQTHEKLLQFFACGDTVFLSGSNCYFKFVNNSLRENKENHYCEGSLDVWSQLLSWNSVDFCFEFLNGWKLQ